MTDTALIERLDRLTQAVSHMASLMGTRLSQANMCIRLDISRATLGKRMVEPGFPRRDASGKWLLSDVLEWEKRQ